MDQIDEFTAEVNEMIHAFCKCIYCKKRFLSCNCNEPEFMARGEKLPKQTRNDIDFLHFFQREKFGKDDDYIGTYSVANGNWADLHDAVRAFRKVARYRKKDIARAFTRSVGQETPSTKVVGQWIKKHYPNNVFAIKKETIPWKEKPLNSAAQERLCSIYKRAFKKGEKSQHGVLKWIGWNWVCELGGKIGKNGYGRPHQFHNRSCVYEQRLLFTPNPRPYLYVASVGTRRSTHIQSGKMQDDKPFAMERGDVQIVADVFGFGISVECGVTKADSLVLPLVHKVCEMTVWIPFFNEGTHSGKDGHSDITAFCIRLKESAKRGWADIVV